MPADAYHKAYDRLPQHRFGWSVPYNADETDKSGEPAAHSQEPLPDASAEVALNSVREIVADRQFGTDNVPLGNYRDATGTQG